MTSNVIAVKSNKIGRKNTNKISADLYKEVQKKCKSIELDKLSSYSQVVPVVSMRTTFSNRAVIVPGGDFYRAYDIKLEQGDKDFYSLSMLSCKQFLIDALQKPGGNIPNSVLEQSIAYPIGMAFIDNKYYLLSHIVVDDKVLMYPEFLLNEGFSLTNITNIYANSDLTDSLYEKLLLIKEEQPNE